MGVQTAITNLATDPREWHTFDSSGSGQTNYGSDGGTWSANGTNTWSQSGSNAVDGSAVLSTTGYHSINMRIASNNSTWGFWFKRSSAPGSDIKFINWYYDGTYNNDATTENAITTAGKVKWGPRYGGSPTAAVSNTNVCDGNWHFIALTRSSTTVKIYIDGVYETSGTVGSSNNATLTSTVDFGIADGANNYYDEFFMCDYLLSDAEIESIWDASPYAATNITITDTAGMSVSNSTFPDPVISLQSNVQYTADIMDTASPFADFISPTVSADSSAEYAADPSTASSEMVDSTVEAIGNVDHTETPATASAEMVDPATTVQVYVSVAADPMDASSLSPANLFFGQTVEDTTYHVTARQITGSISNDPVTTSFTLGTDNAGAGTKVAMAFKPGSGFPPANKIVKASFHPTQVTASSAADAGGDNKFNVYVFTENPGGSFNSMTYANLPAKELLYTTRLTDDGVNFKPDLTAAFNDARSHNYGIFLEHYDTGGSTYDRTEFSVPNGVDDSLLYILTSDIIDKNLNADVVTASGEIVDPSTTTINNLNLPADVVTASGEFVDPVAGTSENTSFTDTPWTASSQFVDPAVAAELIVTSGHLEANSLMVDPTLDITGTYIYYSTEPMGTASAEFMSVGWNIGEENVAVHMDASSLMVDPVLRADNLQYANETNGHVAEMLDPTITVVLNSQTIYATAMEASAALPNPVYSRAIDPYYTRIRELLGDSNDGATASPSYLYIFDGLNTDTYGWKPTIKNANWSSIDGDFNSYGVTQGGIVPAPGGRKATTLTNTGVTYTMGDYNSTGRFSGSKSAVEVVFKTSELEAGMFYNRRYVSSIGGGAEVRMSIKNGKINFELWSATANTGWNFQLGYEGFKNVSDGNWHHVVVNFSDDVVNGPNYFDIYIDGQRDFKRFQTLSNATKGRYPSLVANFTGNIMSVAHYELEISQDDVVKNYYLALDIQAIEADPMVATLASLVQPKKVKGNRARMLVIYTGYTPGFYNDNVRIKEGGLTITDDKEFDYDFGPLIPVYEDTSVGNSWSNVDVFTAPIIGPWRDAVSDDYRTIDLRTDVPLADFDIVSFRDYPNESTEFDAINTRNIGGTTGAKLRDVWQKERETFASNLLAAINLTGVSLYVNDPQLAIDLGIVDRVVQVQDTVEIAGSIDLAGNGNGAFDPRSYDLEPFVGNGRGTGTKPAAEQGIGFSDTHTLAFQRIINEIAGITDTTARSGKYYVKELARFIPYSPFEIDRYSFKYGQASLNDDFYITNVGRYGTVAGPSYRSQQFGGVGDRWDIIATPASNVKAGTIVTAISPTYYNGRTSTANPYAGYATSIAITPGQSINGIQMNAKVFVNFTEPMQTSAPDSAVVFQDQSTPLTQVSASDATYFWGGEAANWQYSTWRHSTSLRNINASVASNTGPVVQNGTGQAPKQGVSQDTVTFTPITLPTVEVYFNYREYNVPRFTPANAGFTWLSDPVTVRDEDAIIRPSALTATAQIVDATVDLEVNKEIFATTMVSTATIVQATNYGLPDALALALPMTVFAQMPEIVKVVYADPMTATTNIGQNFTITASGEMVVLTISHSDAVLYIKEDINN